MFCAKVLSWQQPLRSRKTQSSWWLACKETANPCTSLDDDKGVAETLRMITFGCETWAADESNATRVVGRLLLAPDRYVANFMAGNVRAAVTTDITAGLNTAAACNTEVEGGGEAAASKTTKHRGTHTLWEYTAGTWVLGLPSWECQHFHVACTQTEWRILWLGIRLLEDCSRVGGLTCACES